MSALLSASWIKCTCPFSGSNPPTNTPSWPNSVLHMIKFEICHTKTWKHLVEISNKLHTWWFITYSEPPLYNIGWVHCLSTGVWWCSNKNKRKYLIVFTKTESPHKPACIFSVSNLCSYAPGLKPSLPPSDFWPVQIYAFAESNQPYQQSLSSCFPDVKQCSLEMMDLNLPLHLQSETNVCQPRERQGTWALKTIQVSPDPRILQLGKLKIRHLPYTNQDCNLLIILVWNNPNIWYFQNHGIVRRFLFASSWLVDLSPHHAQTKIVVICFHGYIDSPGILKW